MLCEREQQDILHAMSTGLSLHKIPADTSVLQTSLAALLSHLGLPVAVLHIQLYPQHWVKVLTKWFYCAEGFKCVPLCFS